jgi:spermidine synthase
MTEIDKRTMLAIGGVGFTAIVTQTILLREFLSIFSGNELVIGIVLANWMVLTACGSLLGRLADKVVNKTRFITILLIVASVLPLVSVFLLNYLRNVVFLVGTAIGAIESIYYSFVILLPFCLVSGSLFTVFALAVSEQHRSNRIADVYSLEAMGSVIGGLLFNLLILLVVTTFQALLLMALVDLGICLFFSVHQKGRLMQYVIVSLAILALFSLAQLHLDSIVKRYLYQNQELLACKDTPYGNLAVTRQERQFNFFENGSLLFSTNDPTANEDAVHYAMIQHPHPRTVLLISGGISGTTLEILKYGVDRIDYVEINPSIIDFGAKYTTALSDHRINVVNEDGRRYLRRVNTGYDVALINVPDPTSAQTNRYFTSEFLRELKTKLNSGAVVSFGLLPSVDYLSYDARQVSSVFFNTLKAQFKNVLIIPGLRNHFLGSDGDLTLGIAESISRRGISNAYVNQYYIDDQLLRQQSNEIMRTIDANTAPNTDFVPVAYYRQLLYWLSSFGLKPWIPAVLAGLIFLAIAWKLNTISLGMFTGGFAASSIEIILLISFQIIYGYVYQATGVVIAIFMAGLAVGSYVGRKSLHIADFTLFIGVQFALGIYALLLPAVLYTMKEFVGSDAIIYGVFVVLTLFAATAVGFEFSLASRLLGIKISPVASTLYGVDLIGSAIGALLVSIYLIPLLGITRSSLIVALIVLTSGTAALIARNRFVPSTMGEISYV